MPACELCGEDVNNKGIPLRLYRGYLLQREVSKGELHSTRAVSTYQRFEPVNVLVCSRHLKNLWVQRLIAGLFAYLLLFFPVVMVVSWLVKWHPQATTLQFILGALLSMVLAAVVMRSIKYEAFIASMLTLKESSHEAGHEYFTEKKYNRMMKMRNIQ